MMWLPASSAAVQDPPARCPLESSVRISNRPIGADSRRSGSFGSISWTGSNAPLISWTTMAELPVLSLMGRSNWPKTVASNANGACCARATERLEATVSPASAKIRSRATFVPRLELQPSVSQDHWSAQSAFRHTAAKGTWLQLKREIKLKIDYSVSDPTSLPGG